MSIDQLKFTLRTSDELLQKISYIAGANGRSANKEIEMLLKRYVAQYEKKNGPIPTEDEIDS
ncbi:MAG: Arc family DNA-binding protein [Syntrophomonadaceae bacterium]